jgi:hypothetical protein
MKAPWVALLATAALGCAVPVPPSGGPRDETPPEVVATEPPDSAVGVDPTTAVVFRFSESMHRERLERLVRFEPRVRIGRVRWKGERMILEPAEPLHPDTTYVVELRPGFTDAHRVKARRGYRFAFATAAALDSGRIEGVVLFRRKPSDRAKVGAYRLPLPEGSTIGLRPPDRLAGTDEEGRFVLDYLPCDSSAWMLWAFQDKNGNGRKDAGEFEALLDEPIELAPGRCWVRDVRIAIVDTTEPAVISGRVDDRTGLDTLVTLTLTPIGAERPKYWTVADPQGAFRFRSVHSGRYRLRAFVDLDGDSLCSSVPCDSLEICPEPCWVAPDTLVVDPGAQILLEPIRLEPPKR